MKRLFAVWMATALAACTFRASEADQERLLEAEEAQNRELDEVSAKRAQRRGSRRRARNSSPGAAGGSLGLVADAAPAASEAPESSLRDEEDAPTDEAEGGGEAVPTRAWFPETFLFSPHVPTDAEGRASVEVTVPDRLTTWRVLALAHSREGAQAGAVTRFEGTLPIYVDVVVPPYAHVGDVFELPISIVNTTEKTIRTSLEVDVKGARMAPVAGQVSLPPQASEVRYARLQTTAPGPIVIEARLSGQDAVRRTVDALPTGEPRTAAHSGTLGKDRSFEMALPSNVDPATARLRLFVFPGALAVLRSELATVLNREDAASTAYALLLSGRGPDLVERLGGTVDEAAMRRLRLLGTQRAVRATRAPSAETAALFAEGALSHPEEPLLDRLGLRLSRQVADRQRPDGTFGGDSGWTVQRLLVATAEGLRAVEAAGVRPDAQGWTRAAAVRANGAFERMAGRIDDPYTAAVVASSGGVEGSMLESLRKRVKDALQKRPDGSRVLPVPEGVVRSDGVRPPVVEATAYATLALTKEDPARTDLGAALVSSYAPGTGWGDGRTSLVALMAVLEVFRSPLPDSVDVEVAVDDRPALKRRLAGQDLFDVVTAVVPAPDVRGRHGYAVRASPPVPGLGYRVTVEFHVPWSPSAEVPGLEMTTDVPRAMRVGQPASVVVRAVAPKGSPISLYQALPAGVVPVTESLHALVESNTIARFDAREGGVHFYIGSRETVEPVAIAYRVVPELAGRLHTAVSWIEAGGRGAPRSHTAPAVWTIVR